MVAWLDLLIHHFDAAPLALEVIIASSCTATTGPAELKAAKLARHMIAARILLNPCLAHRADGNVAFVLFSPSCKLVIHDSLTCDPLVPRLLAGEADLCLALRALELDAIGVFC